MKLPPKEHLGQLPFNHEGLNGVDGMDVLHAVDHNAANCLQTLETAHYGHGIALYEDVAVRKELDSLQSRTFGTEETLTTLDETVFGGNIAANLDNIALHRILQNFNSLVIGNTSG